VWNRPGELLTTLEVIGFQVPGALKQIAASGQNVVGSFKIFEDELDRKLIGTTLTTAGRIQLKTALRRADMFKDRR
jgi:hypothetical protein